MTDARSNFEFRRLKVPELKHILKDKAQNRIPVPYPTVSGYTEKEQRSLCCYMKEQNPECRVLPPSPSLRILFN